jgi:hypothetical protein
MQLIQEPNWPSLSREHRALLATAGQALAKGDFGAAAEGYERAYRLLLTNQPERFRFHKGEALHNWGLALLWQERTQEAVERTLEAFVEDAASLAEENPRFEELDRPAAHNLVYVFGLSGRLLGDLATTVRAHIANGGLLPDARSYLSSVLHLRVTASAPAPGQPRIIGQHRLPPERRVFVGGGFAHLDTHLRPIRDIVDSLDYEGVVAADYGVPHGWRSDDVALGLMHTSHFGVFDLSDPAGQMVEIAELPDRKHDPVRTLAVWDTRVSQHPAVSYGMIQERLADWEVVPVPYKDMSELDAIITSWLPRMT